MNEIYALIARVFLRNAAPRDSLTVEINQYRADEGLAVFFDQRSFEQKQTELGWFLTWATYLYANGGADARDLSESCRGMRKYGLADATGSPKALEEWEIGEEIWNTTVRERISKWRNENAGIKKLTVGYNYSLDLR